MAFPVTHVLIPMLIIETYRRYCAKKKFSKWYVFLAGFLGGAPDFDFLYGLIITGGFDTSYHRGITHSMIIPILVLILGFAIYLLYSNGMLKREGWKVSYIVLFIAALSVTTHVFLDGICGMAHWFYPLDLSIELPNLLQTKYRAAFLDGILLFVWLLYDEERLNDVLRFFRLKKR